VKAYFQTTRNNLEIVRNTRGDIPHLPFVDVKKAILGSTYSLSISFITIDEIQTLAKQYKGSKNHKNILSFPYSKTEGEIVMNLQSIRLEAKKYSRTYMEHLLFLTIHGCLHLTGLDHGPKMDKLEKKYMQQFAK
jgi:probable rRNA maturation factor